MADQPKDQASSSQRSLEMRVAELEDRLAKLHITEDEMKAFQKVSALMGGGAASAAASVPAAASPAAGCVLDCVGGCINECAIRACTIIRNCTVVRNCTIIRQCTAECILGSGGFAGGGFSGGGFGSFGG